MLAKHAAPQAPALATLAPEVYETSKREVEPSFENPGAPHVEAYCVGAAKTVADVQVVVGRIPIQT